MILAAAFWWMGLAVIGLSWALSREHTGHPTRRA